MFSGIGLVRNAIAEDARVGVGWHGGGVYGGISGSIYFGTTMFLSVL
jgi:hypothetical protein